MIVLANDGAGGDSDASARGFGPAPWLMTSRALAAAPSLQVERTLALRELRCAALEEANRRQTEFLAVVAHELRNPLAPIRASAELLGRGRCDEETQARLKTIIERQVVHLTRLVDDLLDLTRIRTGKLGLECELVDLRDIADAAVQARQAEACARGQRLVASLPAQPLVVFGDPVRLVQVLANLLDNACKYTQEGGTIELLAAPEGELVLLSVSDNGIGITAEALPHVFEPFAQDPAPPGFSRHGIGLGLAVVNELVEAHGGSVVAHSAGRGSGTRIVVTLPLASGVPSPLR